MTPRAVVVIANWNGRQLLPNCWRALMAQTFRDFEVIVVDNGSTDGSIDWLASQAASALVIRNSTNQGFAAANNQGIRASTAPLIATLNNDALPEADWLHALIDAADQNESIGMFASKILLLNPIGQLDSAGIEVDRTGIAWNRYWRQPDSASVDESVEVFGPSAAAALYRRSMLDQIGLFDETLFAYYEDVDLAWRAHWAGWRCLYVPTARVEHVHSATSGQGSPFKNFLLGRNKWLVILKNYPFSRLWRYVPLMILTDLGAALVATIRTRNVSPIRGRWAAVRLWSNVRHWQREVRVKQAEQSIDWRNIFSPIQLWRRS